jgi:hypothetical protein
MIAQSVLGLLFHDQYRDASWIAATWRGNDAVTLLVAVALLWVALANPQNQTPRPWLLCLGIFAYAVYNYAYYLLGAALNVFFPLYLAAFLLSAIGLMVLLSYVDARALAATFRVTTPVRLIAGYFILLATALTGVWLAMWAAYMFAGRPTPIEPEAFKLVAALDIVLMAPALMTGGRWLWRRDARGYLVTCIAGVQASLYLLVLAVNSLMFLYVGLAAWPGELPVWGLLVVATAAMTLWLFSSAAGRTAWRTRVGPALLEV